MRAGFASGVTVTVTVWKPCDGWELAFGGADVRSLGLEEVGVADDEFLTGVAEGEDAAEVDGLACEGVGDVEDCRDGDDTTGAADGAPGPMLKGGAVVIAGLAAGSSMN